MAIFWKRIQNIQKIYDSHKDYSMAPEKIKIKEEWLSPCFLKNANEFDIKTGNINKIPPNLMPKNNYVAHYRNFKYYLSQGLILKKYTKFQNLNKVLG